MMLSDTDLREVIRDGELAIEPFSDSMIRAAGVTLHLAPEILVPESGAVVDVKSGTAPAYETVMATEDKPFTLNPGDFVLGATFEKVSVGASLGFFIEGRSTLARVGLTIVQTAMLVYPGHRGRAVTLELANHGANPILLYPEMKIARAAVFKLQTPASELYDDTGKYKDQASAGPPIFKNEFRKQ